MTDDDRKAATIYGLLRHLGAADLISKDVTADGRTTSGITWAQAIAKQYPHWHPSQSQMDVTLCFSSGGITVKAKNPADLGTQWEAKFTAWADMLAAAFLAMRPAK